MQSTNEMLLKADAVVAAATKSLQSCLCNSVQPQGWQPTRLPHPWYSPGKNTGVGCHFLLQCMKVKSLSRVWLFETPWTVAYQAPPSMAFSRQGYWSALPLPSPKADEEGEKHWPRNSCFLQVSYQCNASQLMWILTDVVHNPLWYRAELEKGGSVTTKVSTVALLST